MERLLFGVILVLVAIPGVVLTGAILVGMVQYAGEKHPWVLIVAPILLVATAGGMALWQRRRGAVAEAGRHPGITMHRIPVAGGIGLVFVLGYVFMFWHGAPSFRPLVIGLPILGAIVAGIAIWLNERRSDSGELRGRVAGEAGQQDNSPAEARKEAGS